METKSVRSWNCSIASHISWECQHQVNIDNIITAPNSLCPAYNSSCDGTTKNNNNKVFRDKYEWVWWYKNSQTVSGNNISCQPSNSERAELGLEGEEGEEGDEMLDENLETLHPHKMRRTHSRNGDLLGDQVWINWSSTHVQFMHTHVTGRPPEIVPTHCGRWRGDDQDERVHGAKGAVNCDERGSFWLIRCENWL